MIEQGAKTDIKNDISITPLYIAAQNGHTDIVEMLATEENINLVLYKGETILHAASEYNRLDTTQFLLIKGADTTIKSL